MFRLTLIEPSELVQNLVTMLRDIPALVAEMDGDPERIYAYHDEYPRHVSLAQAIHQMPVPAIMVAWQGTGPGAFGGADVWTHQLTLYLRARETFEGDPPAVYYRMFRLITKGVPTLVGIDVLGATVPPSCYPMDLPSISRQTDAEEIDDFEVPITLTQNRRRLTASTPVQKKHCKQCGEEKPLDDFHVSRAGKLGGKRYARTASQNQSLLAISLHPDPATPSGAALAVKSSLGMPSIDTDASRTDLARCVVNVRVRSTGSTTKSTKQRSWRKTNVRRETSPRQAKRVWGPPQGAKGWRIGRFHR